MNKWLKENVSNNKLVIGSSNLSADILRKIGINVFCYLDKIVFIF